MFRRLLLLLLLSLWETVSGAFSSYKLTSHLHSFSSFPIPVYLPGFSFPFPRTSSIVLQAPSCALVSKRKSSLPFGSWNQFRKYLVPTTILSKPLIRRYISYDSYGWNRANAFAFQRSKKMPPKDTKGDTKSRIKWNESKHLLFISNIHIFYRSFLAFFSVSRSIFAPI